MKEFPQGGPSKDYPLKETTKAMDQGKTIPSKTTKVLEQHTNTEATKKETAKRNPKKHGNSPIWPPSHSMTRATEVAADALSSDMPLSTT